MFRNVLKSLQLSQIYSLPNARIRLPHHVTGATLFRPPSHLKLPAALLHETSSSRKPVEISELIDTIHKLKEAIPVLNRLDATQKDASFSSYDYRGERKQIEISEISQRIETIRKKIVPVMYTIDANIIGNMTSGNYEKVLSNCSQIIKYVKDKNDDASLSLFYSIRAIALHKLGRHDEAIKDQNQFVLLSQCNDGELYNVRGTSKYYQKHYDDSIADFDKAIFFGYKEKCDVELLALYHANRALAYEKNNDRKHALKDFERAIKLNPVVIKNYYYPKDERDLFGLMELDISLKNFIKCDDCNESQEEIVSPRFKR